MTYPASHSKDEQEFHEAYARIKFKGDGDHQIANAYEIPHYGLPAKFRAYRPFTLGNPYPVIKEIA